MTSRSPSNRAPFSRHRLLSRSEVAAMQDTSRLANTSRCKARANAHPPRRRCSKARFTPIAEIGIVTRVSETRRTRGNPSVPETPSSLPPQTSPESVLPDLHTFVGIWKKSYKASARCTLLGGETRCTFETCKTLRMTRSSDIYVSNRLCTRERESSDQQASFM